MCEQLLVSLKAKSTQAENELSSIGQINTNPIPCPDGGPECTSMPLTLMGETLADIIHDKAGDPLQIAFDHGAATFELQYGSYTLQGWPPNWAR